MSETWLYSRDLGRLVRVEKDLDGGITPATKVVGKVDEILFFDAVEIRATSQVTPSYHNLSGYHRLEFFAINSLDVSVRLRGRIQSMNYISYWDGDQWQEGFDVGKVLEPGGSRLLFLNDWWPQMFKGHLFGELFTISVSATGTPTTGSLTLGVWGWK